MFAPSIAVGATGAQPPRGMLAAAALSAALFAAAAPSPSAAEVVVAAQTVRPGVVLEPHHLELAPGRAQAGQFESIEEAVGQETKISLYRGRPVRMLDIGPPTLVRRNEIITLTFQRGGLFLRTEGRALENGGLGERIRVMNLDSRLTVTGRVAGPQHVEMR